MLQNFGSLHQTRLFPHCLLNSPAKAVGVCCSCRKPFPAKSCNGWLVFPYGIGNWPCLMGLLECALLYWLYQLAALRDLKPMEKTREVVATMNISMKTSAPPFLVMNLAFSKVHDTIRKQLRIAECLRLLGMCSYFSVKFMECKCAFLSYSHCQVARSLARAQSHKLSNTQLQPPCLWVSTMSWYAVSN